MKSTQCFSKGLIHTAPVIIKPAAVTLKDIYLFTSSVVPTQHHMWCCQEGHTQMEIQKRNYVQVKFQQGEKKLKQENRRTIHQGSHSTGGKTSPTFTTNRFCCLMSDTSLGTLGFFFFFFSSNNSLYCFFFEIQSNARL